jgi:3',5'-cyclic AMP phosphodiesterase CpdA
MRQLTRTATLNDPAGCRKRECRTAPHRDSLMSVLLQISDTHFGTEQQPVLEALVRLSSQQRPDLIVLSGDITQRASKVQFDAARAFVDRLNVPVLAIPGNHDIPLFDVWTRLRQPYASNDLLVLCVNTTRWYRHKNGEISKQQIERVAQRLTQASPAQLRVVVVHQPLAVKHAADSHDLLRGHAQAIQSWAAAGADLLMGGHIHLPYVMPVPNAARPVWAVQAGTAVSSRVRSCVPNSVNIIRCGQDAPDGRCVVEQWDYTSEARTFACAHVTAVEARCA